MASIFSQDKRDFLHKKLDEVILLWARGSGLGSFVFTTSDGTPELQLGIQLGLEDAPDQHQHPLQYQHQHHQTHHRQRGPARRQKDRQRAARHQAAKAAVPAAHHRAATMTAATAVILPFTGKLLPVYGKKTPSPSIPKDFPHSEAVASAAPPSRIIASVVPPVPPQTDVTAAPPAATTAHPPATAFSPASPTSRPPAAARPIKASHTSQAASNVEFVKKQLFEAPLQHKASSTVPVSGQKKNYQMQENDLWTKLFSI